MASYKGAVTSVSNLIQSMIDSPKVYAVIRLTIGLSSYGVEYLLLYYCQTNSYQFHFSITLNLIRYKLLK